MRLLLILAVTFSATLAQHRQSSNRNNFGIRPVAQHTRDNENPCIPTPCGPNTRCKVSEKNFAQCNCETGYVPDGNTIRGCKRQCNHDQDCPDDYKCTRDYQCIDACKGACGAFSECRVSNHRAICTCSSGYTGNPESGCRRIVQPVQRAEAPAPPSRPCHPNPCGLNAKCREQGDRAVCSCPIGFEGDPLKSCRKGECVESRECPSHLVCQQLRCVDPCGLDVCGRGAECTVRNHQPVCSCPRGTTGDPFTNCRLFDPSELCNPTPCGRNTNCEVRTNRAVCSCIDNYIGDPLSGCRPECTHDNDCSHSQSCENNRCQTICRAGACGENAICDVRNKRADCSCPQHYQGDPFTNCYAECTAHDDCPSYQACLELECVDPCVGACGTGADCKVENHKPICSCPKGYTGHPFESCRPFTKDDLCRDNPCGTDADCTPGFDRDGNDRPVCTCPTGYIGNPLTSCQRGECSTNGECPDYLACYGYICQNPCQSEAGSVCGDDADCTVKRHQPVCSCPRGYDGNPLQRCFPARTTFAAGRSKREAEDEE